jgi:hypothetical protein
VPHESGSLPGARTRAIDRAAGSPPRRARHHSSSELKLPELGEGMSIPCSLSLTAVFVCLAPPPRRDDKGFLSGLDHCAVARAPRSRRSPDGSIPAIAANSVRGARGQNSAVSRITVPPTLRPLVANPARAAWRGGGQKREDPGAARLRRSAPGPEGARQIPTADRMRQVPRRSQPAARSACAAG